MAGAQTPANFLETPGSADGLRFRRAVRQIIDAELLFDIGDFIPI
jgi:hypothetical protein